MQFQKFAPAAQTPTAKAATILAFAASRATMDTVQPARRLAITAALFLERAKDTRAFVASLALMGIVLIRLANDAERCAWD
ncbi:hypothetical protein E5D57_012344 [Metarhizium anisopliae]|nr:hypothetical protein E5D57_012344 [Metarhizium anisopliae]